MPTKRDQIAEAIFSQLEMLSEMAANADDQDLANDLKSFLSKVLCSYCERKREELGVALTSTSDIRQCA